MRVVCMVLCWPWMRTSTTTHWLWFSRYPHKIPRHAKCWRESSTTCWLWAQTGSWMMGKTRRSAARPPGGNASARGTPTAAPRSAPRPTRSRQRSARPPWGPCRLHRPRGGSRLKVWTTHSTGDQDAAPRAGVALPRKGRFRLPCLGYLAFWFLSVSWLH